jgi:starch phosphorylase
MSSPLVLPNSYGPNDGRRDMERVVFELAERLPDALKVLAAVAFNYRWSWMLGGGGLFHDIDPDAWRRSNCNPRYVIEATSPRRFQELARDEGYIRRVNEVSGAIAADLQRPPMQVAGQSAGPVAYFCSEFGAHCSLPLYGGGLGVLAGDTLKAASDLALPMVGVGLFYRQGYFHQRLDLEGWQREYWVNADFERLPAVRVTGQDQRPLTVHLQIRSRTVHCDVWRIDFGRVPLFLLNTDREDNHTIDRWITARLYIGDRHVRLAQYAVLGIGGVRALQAMGIAPTLVHLNEGHAALSGFERSRMAVAGGRSFEEAMAGVRRATIFTTHTPVPAGNEGYSVGEVEPVLGEFADTLGVGHGAFLDFGRINPGNDADAFSITPLALRTSRLANGVSKRHGEVARDMWRPLWPGSEARDVPITHVTNGVHSTTWMAAPMQRLLDCYLPGDWRARIDDPNVWDAIDAIPDHELWAVRNELRRALAELVRERSVMDRLSRGEGPEYVEQAARAFDPNVLTIGFARRVAAYKRLYLLVRFPERGGHLLDAGPTPIQLVLAGKAHPQDQEGKQTLNYLFQNRSNNRGRAAFLEDYDLHIAPPLVAGVDLWLNLPRPPLEASGTSGMKVVLNGGLNLSVADGWWEEAYDGSNGWIINTPPGDPQMQDEHDGEALLNLLQNEVIPLFYARGPDGIPHLWLKRMKASMRGLIPRFSAHRMLREYVEKLYTPPAATSQAREVSDSGDGLDANPAM